MQLTFRTTDNTKWGAGKESGLTNTEIDTNFWELSNAKLDVLGGTINGDLTITGNLLIDGSSTTINTTQLTVEDKIITVAATQNVSNQLSIDYAGLQVFTGAREPGAQATPQFGQLPIENPALIYVQGFGGSQPQPRWTVNRDLDITFDFVTKQYLNLPPFNQNPHPGLRLLIDGSVVLTKNSLGAVIVNSSLQSVGTLYDGEWNADIIGADYGGTGRNTTLDPVGTLYFRGPDGDPGSTPALIGLAPPTAVPASPSGPSEYEGFTLRTYGVQNGNFTSMEWVPERRDDIFPNPNTIAVRDVDGNIRANDFIGNASTATAILHNGISYSVGGPLANSLAVYDGNSVIAGTIQLANSALNANSLSIPAIGFASGDLSNNPYTVAVRDEFGSIEATDFNSLSDVRFKTDLVKIDGALGKLKQLTGYLYTLTESGKRSSGLLSQDVLKVQPESVSEKDERLMLNYDSLFGLIVESIKEMDNKLTEIQNQLSNK